MPQSQDVGPQEQHGPDLPFGQRRPDPNGVGPQQVVLEPANLVRLEPHVRQTAQTGGDAVDGLASGLSTVVTDEAQRGKGYGRRLIVAGRDAIRDSGADLGIFTCDRPLQAFYERAGWQVLPGSVLVGGTPDAPFPSDRFDKVVLALFFSPKARQYSETFNHSRIELYPGDRDKLW